MADKEKKKQPPKQDFNASVQQFKELFKKHAGIFFVVVTLAGLVYSVSAVNSILGTPSDENYRIKKEAEMTSTQFDKTTIQKIDALGDRTNPPEPTLPEGRTNPFTE